MRIIFLTTIQVILYLSSTAAYSDDAAGALESASSKGAYIGGAISKDTGYYNFNRRDVIPPLSFIDQDISVLNGTGAGGEIYVGYRLPMSNRFTVAIEGFYDRSNHRAKFNLLDTNTAYSRQLVGSFQQKRLSGLVVRSGFYVNPKSVLYGRAGYIVSQVTLNGNISQSGQPPFGIIAGSLNRPVNSDGVQLGLGIEIEVISRLNLRFEWDWNRVENYVFNNVIRDSQGNRFMVYRTASHPTLEQVKLGLNWLFA
jgi:opacity protein-like surface antigen